MSNSPARNRVIYQSEALFVSPDTTGHHIYYKANSGMYKQIDNPVISGRVGANNPLAGEDITGQVVYFNAKEGFITESTGIATSGIKADTAAKLYYNLNYSTHACSGKANGPTGFNGQTGQSYHPVFDTIGFTGDISGNAATFATLTGSKALNVGNWGTTVEQLRRVQSANYSFTVNRQDINQFGHLGRLDSVVLEAPTVSLDFSYYLTDGYNERLLGMNTDGQFQNLSGIMTRSQNDFGNNYFILTVPEGRDAVLGDQLVDEDTKSVISLGNGYITDYSIEASVGSFPTVSVTVDGLNLKSDKGTLGKSIPSINSLDGTNICDTCFFLPPTITGEGESVLKPGDITIDLSDGGLISKQISGIEGGYQSDDKGSAHVQSFTLSTPLGRSDLQRLGNTYAYAKEIDFPITVTLTVNALVADLKEANLVNLLCGETYDLKVKMLPPACVGCDANSSQEAIIIDFKSALLDSESFSSAIGDNKTVDLTFSTQIGGPEEKGVGVFLSGWENSTGADKKFKHPPTVSRDDEGVLKFYPYGRRGTTGGFESGRY